MTARSSAPKLLVLGNPPPQRAAVANSPYVLYACP
jgi:hypothetical protein